MSSAAQRAALVAFSLAIVAGTAPARADTGPVLVVPSRPGVPIAINGRDASWSVVEGDIGLARPGHLTPVIVGGGRPLPPRWAYDRAPYYPRYGVAPMRGRQEIEPDPGRPMPEPAESFSRSWTTSSEPQYYNPRHESRHESRHGAPPEQSYQTGSDPLPATIDDPQQQMMPPPIVVVPRGRRP